MIFLRKIKNLLWGREFRNNLNADLDDIEREINHTQKAVNDKVDKQNSRIDNLVIEANGDGNAEIHDAHHSNLLNKSFDLIKDRFDWVDSELQNRGVDVTWFGADPTKVIDSSDAFQKAVDFAVLNQKNVFVPEGNYLISKTIYVTKGNYFGCKIVGANAKNVKISADLSANTALFSYVGGSGTFANIGIENMSIDGVNTKQGVAIYIDGQDFGRFENIRIKNMKYGIFLHNNSLGNFSEINIFRDIQIDHCENHIRMEKGGGDDSFHGNVFDNIFMNIGEGEIGFNHVNGYYYNGKFRLFMWSHHPSAIFVNANGNTEKSIGDITFEGNGRITGNYRFWYDGQLRYLGGLNDESTRKGTGQDEHQQVFKCTNYYKNETFGGTQFRVSPVDTFNYDFENGLQRLSKPGVEGYLLNSPNTSEESGFYTGSTEYHGGITTGRLGWFFDSYGKKIKSHKDIFDFQTADGSVPMTIKNYETKLHKGVSVAVKRISSEYNVQSDFVILIDAPNDGFPVWLPDASGLEGRLFKFKRIEGSESVVSISAIAGQKIDGAAVKKLNAWQGMTIISDGANWHTIDFV